jgi:dihydrofolate reductase
MKRPLTLIAAMARNRVIGLDNRMPWLEPVDLKHFQKKTMGHTLIMGRRTAESLVRPLSGRRCLVLSTTRRAIPGFETVPTWEAALEAAYATDAEPMVIGGAQVYALAMPWATSIDLTVLDRDVDGDTCFPVIPDGFQKESEKKGPNMVFQRWVLLTESVSPVTSIVSSTGAL